jgi:hypothetical protein
VERRGALGYLKKVANLRGNVVILISLVEEALKVSKCYSKPLFEVLVVD